MRGATADKREWLCVCVRQFTCGRRRRSVWSEYGNELSKKRLRCRYSESLFVWNRVVLSGVEVVWIGNGSVPKIIIIKWHNKFIFLKLQSAFWWGNCFLILYGRLETLIFRVVQAIKSLPTVCCKGGGIIDNNVAGNRNILDADRRSTGWHTLCLKKTHLLLFE